MLSSVSDASLQKNKQSSFAFVLAYEEQPLWKGVGLALGHADNMYSGQAEAFGLIAGLTFLHYYMTCYGHALFHESTLHCFRDNLGVITNVAELITPSIP